MPPAPGFNCRIGYSTARDNAPAMDVRCRGLSHGTGIIAEESHARMRRAFYPRARVLGQFALTLELTYAQKNEFVKFMWEYMHFYTRIGGAAAEEPFLHSLSVEVTTPETTNGKHKLTFMRHGVPISGVEEGDHVGSTVFTPTITFESYSDPQDPVSLTEGGWSESKMPTPEEDDEALHFFYPFADLVNDPHSAGKVYDRKPQNDPNAQPAQNQPPPPPPPGPPTTDRWRPGLPGFGLPSLPSTPRPRPTLPVGNVFRDPLGR